MKADKIQETIKALEEINKAVLKLDPAIRAGAFDVLRDAYFGKQSKKKTTPSADEGEVEDKVEDLDESDGEFFTKFDHKKPADNVLLIAAWLYSNFGNCVITTSEVNAIATEKGLIVPSSVGMAIRQIAHTSKTLFAKSGKGWKLSVWGEQYVKETYNVKKGTKPRPENGK